MGRLENILVVALFKSLNLSLNCQKQQTKHPNPEDFDFKSTEQGHYNDRC